MNNKSLDVSIINADNEIKKKLRRQINDFLCKYATFQQLKEIADLLKIK